MKRFFSILLLIVFLFNVGGYHLLMWALRYQSGREFTALIDAGKYNEKQTIELKIPVSLPYSLLEEKEHQRLIGDFHYKGDFYHTINYRIEDNNIYIVAIKNTEGKRIVDTITSYAAEANDLPGTGSRAMSFLGKLLKEFHTTSTVTPRPTATNGYQLPKFVHGVERTLSMSIDVISPPPEA